MMDQCESVATGSIPGTPRTCLTSVDYHGALPTHFRHTSDLCSVSKPVLYSRLQCNDMYIRPLHHSLNDNNPYSGQRTSKARRPLLPERRHSQRRADRVNYAD